MRFLIQLNQKLHLPLQATALLLLVFINSLSFAAELTTAEREYLDSKGTVVFISQTQYPPFEFRSEDGNRAGMCIELARWIATRFGFKTKFIDTSFKEAQEAVICGDADVITSLFFSKKREMFFDFTQVMFQVPASIFVAADRPDIRSLQDLEGKTIAMQAGDYAQEFLQTKGIKFRVVWTKNFNEATDLVIAGKADAIIGDEQIVLYHIYSNRLTKRIKKVGDPLYVGQNCMGLREGNKILRGILDKGITMAKETGTLDRIYATWLGVPYKAGEPWLHRNMNYLLYGAGALVLFAFLIWVWNLHLRRLVAKHTEALTRSEKTLRAILESAPIAINVIGDRVLAISNPAMADMLGYSLEELKGLPTARLYPSKSEYERVGREFNENLQLGENKVCQVETTWVGKNGREVDVWLQIFPIEVSGGSGRTVVGVAVDITERKRSEIALQNSEERFRLLTEESPLGISMVDSDGKYVYLNQKFTEIFGYTLSDIPEGGTWFKKAFPDEGYRAAALSAWVQDLKESVAGEARPRVFTVTCKDGSNKIVDFRPVTTSTGQQFIIYQDITERMRMEEALSESEQRYRQVFERSPVPLFMQDFSKAKKRMEELEALGVGDLRRHLMNNQDELQGILGKAKLIFANQATVELYEAGSQEEMLATVADFSPPETSRHFIDQLIDFYNGKESYEGFGQNKTIKGNIIDIFVKKAVLPGYEKDLSRVLTTVMDLTEIKKAQQEKERLESQLRQAQKMEAVGTLAGGIAHDFNNILSIIMGYAELAQLEKNGQDGDQKLVQIVHAAERARKLVKQLLTFSRMSEIELKPIDINHTLAQSIEMLRHTIPKMIEIEVNLAHSLGTVRADATQLEQVIINLAGNACDAMPEGGRLVFETSQELLDNEYTEEHFGLPPGDYILISVSDTGHGMDPKTQAKIFDPFYTTKGVGRGTGLGLSTVYGIIKEHGGHISCYSEPGIGTTFKIYLPILDVAAEPTAARDGSEEIILHDHGAVLLVDDEEAIRELGKEILVGSGLEVITAASGEEALELYADSREEIELVVLDLGMPGMGGHRCLKELLAINPRLKVLVASGYSAEAKTINSHQGGASGFIAKPFRRNELLRKVKEILEK